jgi:hypothetical protein
MAVRLQMKLGVVPEQDRRPDSPDAVVVVEPSVGSIARSKGQLYLLVTSRLSNQRAAEAARIAAETVRNEYYYDESAGIRVCLEKAIESANKRLAHQRDRLGLGRANDGNGPIGIGVAVVRGNELYVATVGPAEAYLIRQARLSTLPDPHRERGLPTGELAPDVWRGEISVGDSLVLISPNVVAKLGPDELKDAMVTLHPQSAMEHLHQRFVAANGKGSDGAIAFEATEVAATQRGRAPVPVRAAEPLAGAPDRSPIPLADPVVDGVAAVQAGALQARVAAGTALERAVRRLQDFLPRRKPAYRRVTPLSARRETQRRAAVAVLAFVVVAIGLGLAVFVAGGQPAREVISSVTAGQRALDAARADLDRVFAPGVDLVANDPRRARELLTSAWNELATADRAGMPATTVGPVRARVLAGLDRLFGVVAVTDSALFSFDASATPPTDLRVVVRGPDAAPYVMDATTKTVYRIDLKAMKATIVLRAGTKAAGVTAGLPKFLTVGGPDLLILDDKNRLWRWRPANTTGRGTLTHIRVIDAASWGNDLLAIGTFGAKNNDLYNLYLIDPSAKQILSYSPAAEGGLFPSQANPWLDTARPVDGMTSLYIDGDVFVTDHGALARYVSGNGDGWTAATPGDELLRKPPHYTIVASGSPRRTGRLYAYDDANHRIIALDKAPTNGTAAYRQQYVLAGSDALADIRGMYVVAGLGDVPDTVFWISANTLHQAPLVAIGATPGASPSPSGGSPSPPGASASPGRSGSPSPTP